MKLFSSGVATVGVVLAQVFFGVLVWTNNIAGVVGQSVFGLPNNIAPILTAIGVLMGLHGLAKVRLSRLAFAL